MSKTQAVFFDLDNTLYPQIEDIIQRIEHCIHFFQLSPAKEIKEYWIGEWKNNGPQKTKLIEKVILKFGLPVSRDEVIEEYRVCRPVLVISGTHRALLLKIQKHNIFQFLITNGNPGIQKSKVEALRLEPLFDRIIYATGERAKPSQYWYNHLISEYNILPHYCISVGDWYAIDGIAAKKANIRFIHISGGPIKEIIPEGTDTITYLSELMRYIDYD